MRKLKNLLSINIIFLLCFVFFGVVIPLLYLSRPLHLDEATFLVIGDSVKNGALLYQDVVDNKPPGIFYLAALVFSVAGKSFIATRIFTLIVQAASALLILALGVRIKDKNVGMIAALFFLVGAYIPSVVGYFYLTEPYAVFFIILSVLFFLKEGYRAKFIAGLALGMGVLFKQTTLLLFGVFFLFYLLRLRFQVNRTNGYVISSTRNLIVIFSGLIIPLLIVFLYFLAIGTANEMVYYTLLFLSGYGLPFSMMYLETSFFAYLLIWLLSIGMILFVGYTFLRGKTLDDKHLFFVLWMLILSIPALTIFPDHRVLFAVPPAAVLAALLLSSLYQNFKRKQISVQMKCFIITTLIVTTAITAGMNIYRFSIGSKITINDQMRVAEEIEGYVDGKVYIFPFDDNMLFFFSNLTSGVTYLGTVCSDEIAQDVIKDFQFNNVSYVIALKWVIDELEKGQNLTFFPKPHKLIYDYIQEHYQILTLVENRVIYKLRD